MEEREIDAYIAPGRAKHAGEGEGASPASPPCAKESRPAGTPSPYRLRKQLPEPVFGQIKQARGFRQFLLRGVEKVASEWGLVCLADSILKLAQGRTPSLAALATGCSFATSETVQRTMAAKLPPLHQTGCANLLHPALRLA